jgi:UDP-glucose 4-epimerase
MNATDCAANPVEALDVNGVATARLVQSALSSGVRRFVYLSTAHVYGAPLVGRMDESVPPRPVHPYATSHRAAEDVVRAAAAQGQIEGVVVRLSNGWGAPVDPAVECWHLLMNDLCRQAVQTGRIVVRSDGTQRRDLIPLGDVCRALQHLALSPTVDLPDTVVNVGGDWAPTVAEVAHLVADRAAAVTGTMPGVHLGTRSESGAGQPLDYCNDRLRATGFMHDPAQRDLELDRLLRLCVSLTQ